MLEEKTVSVPLAESNPAAKTEVKPAEKALAVAEASILIHDYDYVFSDFDPRPYLHRSISDDFLVAVRKATLMFDPSEAIELKFLIPKERRNDETENAIKKRLHEYFKRHLELVQKEIRETHTKGGLLAAGGFVLMVAATQLASQQSTDFVLQFVQTIFEPAGWFATWFGLDQIFYTAAQKKTDLQFHQKMSKCKIVFEPF